jgi:hypothetical protein
MGPSPGLSDVMAAGAGWAVVGGDWVVVGGDWVVVGAGWAAARSCEAPLQPAERMVMVKSMSGKSSRRCPV